MQSNHTGGGGQPRSQLQHGCTVTILITCHGAHNILSNYLQGVRTRCCALSGVGASVKQTTKNKT